jgi:hypothetical protein
VGKDKLEWASEKTRALKHILLGPLPGFLMLSQKLESAFLTHPQVKMLLAQKQQFENH